MLLLPITAGPMDQSRELQVQYNWPLLVVHQMLVTVPTRYSTRYSTCYSTRYSTRYSVEDTTFQNSLILFIRAVTELSAQSSGQFV